MKHFLLALIAAIVVPTLAYAQSPEQPRNVILFISDGCGPASFTLAREYLRATDGRDLAVDHHLVGSISTWAANSRVTDSAASGTAMACGVKTNNGRIAVDTLGRSVASVLEAAEDRGMASGLVVTSTISHATPASFSSHVPSRSDQVTIARQQLNQGIEVLFGGGEEFYLSELQGGQRKDGVDLFDIAREKGYQIARNRAEFQEIDATPAVGIFRAGQMTFEIDRDPELEPSLSEMTQKALDLLSSDPNGFFLMVEGSRIDHAGHANDAAAHLHEILEFDRAFAAAIAFAEEDGSTLVVSTSDHETGGLTLGRNVDNRPRYEFDPELIGLVPASVQRMIQMAEEQGVSTCELLESTSGIDCTAADSTALEAAAEIGETAYRLTFAEVISKAVAVGWTSFGHTAVDVPVFAYGPGWEHFAGHHDNTNIALGIENALGLDLEAATDALTSDSGGSY